MGRFGNEKIFNRIEIGKAAFKAVWPFIFVVMTKVEYDYFARIGGYEIFYVPDEVFQSPSCLGKAMIELEYLIKPSNGAVVSGGFL
ncbi:hypothetical protein BVK86_15265 [Pseudomonas reinekei]|uniref:Uncharacterized protein n=1 Tax=Pseudomonas reinekei TaxID=395598 RepID=A0A1Q9WTV4_PSERE|nr:hypothetical protein BVK86_15265 [Pseudomonas reinekei]